MRLHTGLVLIAALGGCASAPRDTAMSGQAMRAYIVIDEAGRETCYLRFVDGLATDRVCVDGDFIRYTQYPDDLGDAPVVPDYVSAMFDNSAAVAASPPASGAVEVGFSVPGTAAR